MATIFTPGQTLSRTDLNIFLVDENEEPITAYDISYAVYFVDTEPSEVEVLIGSATRIPVNPTIGEYYAALMVPPTAEEGTYRIRWSFKRFANSATQTVTQEFTVVASATANGLDSLFTSTEVEMARSLRILLRDQNPDKYYHFRPPEHEGRINKYNKVFGQIWEDAELVEYLNRSLDWWNMFPPATYEICSLDRLQTHYPSWRTAIYWNAMTHALFALAVNWSHEEFSVLGNTMVRIYVDNDPIDLTIKELYDLIYEEKN